MVLYSDQLPLVSIVLPLNQETVLDGSIESCLRQAYPRIDPIIVDDGSNNRFLDLLRRHESRLRIVPVPRNIGLCAARNIGLSHAEGELIIFPTGNDLQFPNRFRQEALVYARAGEADVVVSINRWFRDGQPLSYDTGPICRRERRLLRHLAQVSGRAESSLVHMLKYDGPQHSCLLYRTATLRDVGGYADESERYADRELLFRVLCKRANVVLNPQVTSAWKMYDASSSSPRVENRHDEHVRLSLAQRYIELLRRSDLLSQPSLREATITHLIAHVHQYALQRKQWDVASKASALISRLAEGHGSMNAPGLQELVAHNGGLRNPPQG